MKSGPGTLVEDDPLDAFARPPPQARFGNQLQSQFGRPAPAVQGPPARKQDENVYTTVIAKVSNLPPGTDALKVEQLFADHKSLNIVKVEKIPPSGPATNGGPEGRPSVSYKVTFSQDANARDLDDAMNKMNDKKYMGRGYYLHLDRYLGSRSMTKEQQKLPFGARWVAPDTSKGYAPTAELTGASGRAQGRDDRERLVVTAYPPPDAPTLRLIHTTVEGVIKGGMEFEAALMEDKRVQTEERFAWFFDQRHPLNRYYRWRLYQMVCGHGKTNVEIFRGMGEWEGPAEPLPDEFACRLEHLDPDAMDAEGDDEDVGVRRMPRAVESYPGYVDSGNGILSVRSRAMLMWFLTTIPFGAPLNEEIAPLSAFAIDHATEGMDEVIQLIISNVIRPFSLTEANPKYNLSNEDADADSKRRRYLNHATLNALRIVSDICFTTHKAGGKSWKYRDAIGTELRERGVFEYLDTVPQQLQLGRTSEAQFRSDVNKVVEAWKEEILFTPDILDQFDNAFNWRKKQKEKEEQERKQAERRAAKAKISTEASVSGMQVDGAADDAMQIDVDDASKRKEVENTNTHPQGMEKQDQQSMQEQSLSPEKSAANSSSDLQNVPSEVPGETAAARARRMRPKAEDMFASDEE